MSRNAIGQSLGSHWFSREQSEQRERGVGSLANAASIDGLTSETVYRCSILGFVVLLPFFFDFLSSKFMGNVSMIVVRFRALRAYGSPSRIFD